MKQLKQILIDRITNIVELKRVFKAKPDYQDNKYDYIVEQKKIERMRSLRQNDLLMSMSNMSFYNSASHEEIFKQSVEICGLYDAQFMKYKSDPEDFSLKKLYVQFFNTHGFQEKGLYINNLFQKDRITGLSPALFFGWLSEWSKKIYCEILQKEIEKSFTNKEKSPKSLNNSITLGLLESKSRKLEKCMIQNNNTELSEISLSNRPNIQSYFSDDLQAYYKLTGIQGVDITYLKTIRKRFQKEEFLKPQNLSRAVATLIECPANKQISNIMKTYEAEYASKFPKQQQRQVVNFKTFSNPNKVIPFCAVKRKTRIITESDESTNINQNRFYSPKRSELEFNPEDLQNKFKRIKIISHFKSLRNNLQFPGLGLNFKKDFKPVQVVPDRNLFRSAKNRQQVIASLQSRLKQKDFLKCQSILSKYRARDDPDFFSSKVYSSELCSPIKDKKLEVISTQYDDQKLKIAKIFQLADLKTSKKYTKNRSYLQQAY